MLDRIFRRNREPQPIFGSVEYQLFAINRWKNRDNLDERRWEYFSRVENYLQFAKQFALDGDDIVYSCFDLAASLDNQDPYINTEKEVKITNWNALRKESLNNERGTRVIEMNLDPAYFHAILLREKSFEGRALDLTSGKHYPDIRRADIIRFTLKNREFWHKDVSRQLGIKEGMVMEVDVGDVLFSPLVHWMYEFNWCDGKDFQPMITGVSELLYLQSAGIYYTFPNYPQKISDSGFIGIEVQNPSLIK